MAETALEVVSLNEFKAELRIGGTTDASRTAYAAQDAILQNHIEAAIALVSRETHLPLIDRQLTIRAVNANTSERPILLRARSIKSVTRIRYWTLTDSERSAPTGEILASDLGRLEVVDAVSDSCKFLWPPESGWPERFAFTDFLADAVVGVDLGVKTLALKQAVILAARHFYDGHREMRPTAAVNALIDPWRYEGYVEPA